MGKLQDILINKREDLGLSLRDAGDMIGISHSYLSTLEKGTDPRNGSPVNPTPDTLKLISKAYKISYHVLMEAAGYLGANSSTPAEHLAIKESSTRYHASNATPAEMIILPILGNIRAGKPLFAEEHLKGHMPFPKKMLTPGYDHFLLTIDGDSMIGDGIDHGDTALIRVQNFVEYDKQIAAVLINGCEACLKHVIHPKGSDMVILRSSNPKYQDIIHPANDLIVNGVYAGVFKAPKNG